MTQDAAAPIEPARLATLQQMAIEDRALAPTLDRLARMAAKLLNAQIACIVVVSADRQTILGSVGLPVPQEDWRALALPNALCEQVARSGTVLLIDDFRAYTTNAGVPATDLAVAAYAGIPLTLADRSVFGVLCVTDEVPHPWTADDGTSLHDLAGAIMSSIEARYAQITHMQAAQQTQATLEQRVRDYAALLEEANRRLADELAERKVLAHALVEIQKRESLSMLASGIAHNFNNLLTTILGNAEMAQLELPPDSPVQASITPIMIAAQRAAALTHEMLVYAGEGSLIAQPLDLNNVVASVIPLLSSSVARHVTLTCEPAPWVPAVVADAAQIRQSLTNLVTNAVEAIGDAEGSIHVSTSVLQLDAATLSNSYRAPELLAGTYVSLAVSDNGCGMDAATCAKIFDPFFTTKFIGRGLGLAAVQGIVRAHGGAINVESTPGRGTTVHMVFPAIDSSTLSEQN
jgi:signal transduction histidine kinase